jgi:hypothetical protein
MRFRHVGAPRALAVLAVLAILAAFAACTLNPQPLPPRDEFSGGTDSDASAKADAGAFGNGPQTPGTSDAGTGTPSADSDGGDGGGDDGGDGGDGGSDADADGG